MIIPVAAPVRHRESGSCRAPSGALRKKSGANLLSERTAESLLFQRYILISRLEALVLSCTITVMLPTY